MTLREARNILGLGPDDDPRPHMQELGAERENLAKAVRNAPNQAFAMRHQANLVQFDQALATIRETLEAIGLDAVPEESPPQEAPPEHLEPTVHRRKFPWLPVFSLILLAVGCAGAVVAWREWEAEKTRTAALESRLAELEQTGNTHMENRRWDDAASAFREIERLAPDRPLAKIGLAQIEVGIAEERSQFVGYWTGEARAALDSGRWDDAESAANKVLLRFPDQPDAAAVLKDLAGAKIAAAKQLGISQVNAQLELGEVEAAVANANALATSHPADAEIASLVVRANGILKQKQADRARANALLEKALARDTGTFDAQALEWLREAALLAPDDAAIATHLEKMASYTRTIRVPEDVADLEEALASARENDRIVIAPGTWQGTFVVNRPLKLQGAGPLETILECPAIAGCAITLGPQAQGSRISGITFQHSGFDPGADRYSTALVRAGAADFVDCHFTEASGHGLAVIEGAQVTLQRCQFRNHGWNGLAVIGNGSSAKVTDSGFVENFGHGVEAWDGATVSLARCRIRGNAGNAVHLDTPARDIRIEDCELIDNREFGIVLSQTSDAHISNNRIRKNQLGGAVVRGKAERARVEGNTIEANAGPGLLLAPGIDPAAYHQNAIHGNAGGQIVPQSP